MLNNLIKISMRPKKRLGRGYGSGKGGHTSGRGTKGQRARVGQSIPLWFEGGQLPLTRRFPYLRGKFKNKTLNQQVVLLKLEKLEKLGLKEINRKILVENKIIRKETDPVKIVGNIALSFGITVEGILFRNMLNR